MEHSLLLLVTSIIATMNCKSFIPANAECVTHPACKYTDSVYAIHLPYYGDCHKFYLCTNGRACLLECPKYDADNRLVYDPELDICNWPWEVPNRPNCLNQDPPGSTSSSTESTTSTSTEPTTTSTTTEPTTTSTSTKPTTTSTSTQLPVSPTSTETTSTTTIGSVTPPHPDARCPSTGTKDISHETDCNYFYRCENGHKSLMKCLENHVFNPIIENCDESWNYRCKTTHPVVPNYFD